RPSSISSWLGGSGPLSMRLASGGPKAASSALSIFTSAFASWGLASSFAGCSRLHAATSARPAVMPITSFRIYFTPSLEGPKSKPPRGGLSRLPSGPRMREPCRRCRRSHDDRAKRGRRRTTLRRRAGDGLSGGDLAQDVKLFERLSRAHHHRRERVLREEDR